MLGTYFYHEIIRRNIIAFGTLFNNIEIQHRDANGAQASMLKVPLAYAPIQKFLARIQQQPNDASKRNQLTVPRMSFELTGIQYDPTRKSNITQTFKALGEDNKVRKVFMPVPYNLKMELYLMTKLNEDALQVVEQILPFFQPAFNVTIDLADSIGESRDTPVVLDGVTWTDNYDKNNFDSTRIIVHTFNFTMKTHLFGPIADSSDGLIKKVQVDYYASVDRQNAKRQMRYTATPKALQDYNDDGLINAADDPYIIPGDDFGFNEGLEDFGDFKTYSPSQGIDVDL
ncbi:tail sheath stabilizer [Synechococcus phage DSL-LC03]|nr:tail sheath stabilizer [Synechococcus phage DSL-LC03]